MHVLRRRTIDRSEIARLQLGCPDSLGRPCRFLLPIEQKENSTGWVHALPARASLARRSLFMLCDHAACYQDATPAVSSASPDFERACLHGHATFREVRDWFIERSLVLWRLCNM